jgi:hypothetical protein
MRRPRFFKNCRAREEEEEGRVAWRFHTHADIFKDVLNLLHRITNSPVI